MVGSQSLNYNRLDNITYKSDVGNYRYGNQCATSFGPHAMCETTTGFITAMTPMAILRPIRPPAVGVGARSSTQPLANPMKSQKGGIPPALNTARIGHAICGQTWILQQIFGGDFWGDRHPRNRYVGMTSSSSCP